MTFSIDDKGQEDRFVDNALSLAFFHHDAVKVNNRVNRI
ncbi:hypothetical protein ALT1545_90010 [Alteromonas macleodii]